MYQILLQRDGTQATMCGRTHGDPSPPYTGRCGGGGTRKRERTRYARSPDQLRHRAALSRDGILAERGGDPPRHRSCDTRQIVGEMHALGLVGPMRRLNRKYKRNTHLFSVHTPQAHIQSR